jgi:GntR family transcriptional repressor for pyruvate dehydrogenase complex
MIRANRVVDGIQEMIQREAIPAGGRLPTEHALARRFRVSRPLVREALQALRALGVVESKPRVGLRVLPFRPEAQFDALIPRIRTEEERAELYELRCLLEPAVLRLAARRARPAELDALERPLRVPLPRARAAAVREGLERDIAFHEGLWRLAGNRFVLGLKGLLVRYFAALERGVLSVPALRRANAQHLAVVRALKAGDLLRAERALARNLDVFRPDRSKLS